MDDKNAFRSAIFITGAARGIGLATAKRFAAAGWFVGMADVDRQRLESARSEVGNDRSVAVILDVRHRSEWHAALKEFAEASGGRLDILVNNAGIVRFGLFEDIPADDYDALVDINLKGAINGAYCALPLLKSAPSPRLINVASCAALYGGANLAVYSATKSALRGLSEALDTEFSSHGIEVRCIMPWSVETAMLDETRAGTKQTLRDELSSFPIITAEDVANDIWLAAHDKGLHYPVGSFGKRLRLVTRLFPNLIRNQSKKRWLADRAGK